MFGKLLKYDVKNYMRFFLPIIITMIVTGMIMLLTLGIMQLLEPTITDTGFEDQGNSYTETAGGIYDGDTTDYLPLFSSMFYTGLILIISFGFEIISAGVVILLVFSFIFYFRSIFTRGYFTFSVPARPSSILASKLIVIYVGAVCSLVVVGAVITAASMLSYKDFSLLGLFSELISLRELIPDIVIILLAVAFIILLVTFFTLFGSSLAKTRKTAGAILWSLLGTYGVGIVLYFTAFFVLMLSESFMYNDLYILLLQIFTIVSLAGVNTGLFFVSRFLINRKHELV